MIKAYKYRIYPNKQQKELIQKTFGCCRFVYNQTLAHRKELYETKKESMSRIDCNNWKNKTLKVKYIWLKEVDKFALDNAIPHIRSSLRSIQAIQSSRVNVIRKNHILLTLQMVI